MSENNDSGEKEHEATQKRLDDSRKQGEAARSNDLNSALSLSGLYLGLVMFGASIVNTFGQFSQATWGAAGTDAVQLLSAAPRLLGSLVASSLIPMLPLFVLPIAGTAVAIVLQGSFSFTLSNLAPKLNRVSPFSSIKNKFGPKGLLAFVKSLLKVTVVVVLLGSLLANHAPEIVGSVYQTVPGSSTLMLQLLLDFLGLVVMISVVFGLVDFCWQVFQHKQKNKMSRKEIQDEAKESDGDPHVKAQRRQKGQEIAMNQMLLEIPKADVILVNPTHYAVALKWDKSKKTAPILVAKGVDEVAARIRKIAQNAQIPIQSDPPTTRLIYATVRLGDPIRPEHYRAVAAAIRFAEAMRRRRPR
jgi:flagellar biosynthetic protein FlhB